jgi:hypothetical protein
MDNVQEHNICSNLPSSQTFISYLLEDALEERGRIPLETVQNFHESIPRRTAAVLKAKDGPTSY